MLWSRIGKFGLPMVHLHCPKRIESQWFLLYVTEQPKVVAFAWRRARNAVQYKMQLIVNAISAVFNELSTTIKVGVSNELIGCNRTSRSVKEGERPQA